MESILPSVNCPADIKSLTISQLRQLCDEIRDELIEITSKHGGHLGSNLGVVELTVALHKVFDSPKDKFIFDVSHQGYVHKILTGRKEYLHTLRQTDGCSGFLQREESEHDHFGAGHAGTALSSALGFAAARDALKTDDKIVAIVGDGGLGCGVSLEALNNAADTTKDIIFVLNDNKMSISPNVGGMSKYLNRIITDGRYNHFKSSVADLVKKIPGIGSSLKNGISKVEEAAKGLLIPGVIFEELGLRYFGPVDGHDLEELISTFKKLKELNQPVLLHLLTEKGHGYEGAKNDPEKCHGFKKKEVASKDSNALSVTKPAGPAFSNVFGEELCNLAKKDDKVVSITAGMLSGTGMQKFKDVFPEKVYDVGIAEEHGTIFAAGMAGGGLKPIVGIYATFMQRAMDCVYHDICLQELPVIFCMDRAGIVEDGPTHHGIVDISFWRSLPNLHILQPRDATELRLMMNMALDFKVASVIRYPKTDSSDLDVNRDELVLGKSEVIREGKDICIWASGRECEHALEVANILSSKNIEVKVVNTRFLAPFDQDALLQDSQDMPIITLEDHIINGGLASICSEILTNKKHNGLVAKGYPSEIIPWGKTKDIRQQYGLLPEQIASEIEEYLKK
ncbi:MAG: 1-deoxy-D-xylulose-5-phosphate synthase [Lentisphaeraceae bacterium]|nr:1-deoxy-D-xylulose-5-phosphate synthase [Lentisphaeraceae bacterium]